MLNNPLKYIDPDGRAPDSYYRDKDGNIKYTSTTSEAEFNNSNIEGEYIAEEFIGIDQYQSVQKYNRDGTISFSTQNDIKNGIKVIAIKSKSIPKNSISVHPDKSGNAGKLNQFAEEFISAGPQALQDMGNGAALLGYGLTLSVVGAPIGVPLASTGNALSTIGSAWEAGNKLADGDINNSAIDATFIIGGTVLSNQVKRIPGTSQLSKEILKQNVNLKVELIEMIKNHKNEK